jgi:hypothetical protein
LFGRVNTALHVLGLHVLGLSSAFLPQDWDQKLAACRFPSPVGIRNELRPGFLPASRFPSSFPRLRAYDAVQMATALDLHKDWTADRLGTFAFVSADRNLNAAALAEGLTVDDPNSHL